MIGARDLVDGSLRVRAHRNESPLPPPQHVIDAVCNADGELFRRYPVDMQRNVAKLLARRLGVRSSNVVLANGADEAILAASRVALRPGDNAVTLRPTFGMYSRAAGVAGAAVREVPYVRRWELDPNALLRHIDDRTRLICLCHPNNPTGDLLDPAALERVIAAAPRALIVIDEVYVTMRPQSLIRFAHSYPNVAVIASLSKIAGLAGLRVGYVVASPLLARAFRRVLAPFALSSLSLIAAEAYLRDEVPMRAFERAVLRQTERSLDAVAAAVSPYALAVWRGPATYALVDLGIDPGPLRRALRRRGIAVRTFSDPSLRTCVRISALDNAGTEYLVEALDELLPGYARRPTVSA